MFSVVAGAPIERGDCSIDGCSAAGGSKRQHYCAPSLACLEVEVGLWRAGVADAAGCELDGSVEGEALSEFHLLCLVALDDVVASESAALGPLRS